MQVLTVSNVNEALAEIMSRITYDNKLSSPQFVEMNSRNGKVLKATTPFTTAYTKPQERVLFNELRDGNPLFHYLESMWMLSGRDDVAFPAYYAKQIASYSDDGHTLNGAYGHRWRNFFDEDQLELIIEDLLKNNESRRAVLQMWNAMSISSVTFAGEDKLESDLAKGKNGSKDLPCNLSTVFQVRKGFRLHEYTDKNYLDMTVFNRSNDIIWGAYGANAVHFSVLQELIASCIGVNIGTYYQVSNNFHIYPDVPVVKKLLDAALAGEFAESYKDNLYQHCSIKQDSRDFILLVKPTPLFPASESVLTGIGLFAQISYELNEMFNLWDELEPAERAEFHTEYAKTCECKFEELPIYLQLATAMISAYEYHKIRDYPAAIRQIETLIPNQQSDWRYACVEWFKRRQSNLNIPTNTAREGTAQ